MRYQLRVRVAGTALEASPPTPPVTSTPVTSTPTSEPTETSEPTPSASPAQRAVAQGDGAGGSTLLWSVLVVLLVLILLAVVAVGFALTRLRPRRPGGAS